ncbi:MAG: hypothetical protein GQ527_06205 [Bacteroidales bacterium]|nr:hypothetical protein [Bacteroidales bacterium]
MKDFIKHIKKLVLVIVFGLLSISLMADPPDPNGGDGGGALPGGGAPVGSGLALFIGLAAAYGAKKTINYEKQDSSLS